MTEAELRNNLRGHTVYGDFVAWLEKGFPQSRFSQYDAAGSGALNIDQLEIAVQQYIMHLQTQPASPPIRPTARRRSPAVTETLPMQRHAGQDQEELAWSQTKRDAEAAEALAARLGSPGASCSDQIAATEAKCMGKLLRKVSSQPRPIVEASMSALRTPMLGEALWGSNVCHDGEQDSALRSTVERVFEMLLVCERAVGGKNSTDRVTVLGLSAGMRELGFKMEQEEVKELIWEIDERLQTDPYLYMTRK